MAFYTFHLFAGAGGGILADELLGFQPIGAVEIEPYPREVLLSRQADGLLPNFPVWDDVKTFSISNENTREYIQGLQQIRGKLCICGGFPCFAKGTFILTEGGYKPIEEVVVGDSVLTHNGRWRRVTATMQRDGAEIWTVKGFGILKTETTGNHRYYIRRGETLDWIPVQDMAVGDFTTLPIPEVEDDEHSVEWWRLAGRYLADGWRVRRLDRKTDSGRVVIACCDEKYNALAKMVKDAGYNFCPSRERTCWKFHITNTTLYRELEQFGKYAYGKTLNRRALCLPEDKARALLEGYLSGDGCVKKSGIRSATTTSPALAFGFSFLAKRLGENVGIYKFETRGECYIEGRICNTRDMYELDFYNRSHFTFSDEQFVYNRVRGIQRTGRLDTVYNLSVEEDESYIANGAVVHNCQDISAAGKAAGITGKRSGLWSDFARIIGEIRPSYVFVENSPLLVKRGLDTVIQDLAERGYSFAYRIVSAQDIGAPHQRKRFWGLAVSNSLLDRGRWLLGNSEMEKDTESGENTDSNSEHSQELCIGIPKESEFVGLDELHLLVSNSLYNRNVEWIGELQEDTDTRLFNEGGEAFHEVGEWGSSESGMGGVVNGFSDWVDRSLTQNWFVPDELGLPRISDNSHNRVKRLKALGNAQVPLCAAMAFELLLKDFKELTNDSMD